MIIIYTIFSIFSSKAVGLRHPQHRFYRPNILLHPEEPVFSEAFGRLSGIALDLLDEGDGLDYLAGGEDHGEVGHLRHEPVKVPAAFIR